MYSYPLYFIILPLCPLINSQLRVLILLEEIVFRSNTDIVNVNYTKKHVT